LPDASEPFRGCRSTRRERLHEVAHGVGRPRV